MTMHPIEQVVSGFPRDQQEAARRESVDIDALLAAVEALANADAAAGELLQHAARELGQIWTRYQPYSKGEFVNWYVSTHHRIHSKSVALLGPRQEHVNGLGWTPWPSGRPLA